ncbi:MAG: type II toxin-antitoxin system VapC family toxin [Lautropia sp.]
MIAVDTNLLVYAHRADVDVHAAAQAALELLASRSSGWAIPWPCAHEFLAVVTGAAFGRRRTPLAIAFEALRAWLAHPRCTALGEPPAHLTTLDGLCQRAGLQGGAIHDARIAAICLGHGVEELWTCDRDFDRFPDLKVRNPLIPSLHEPAPASYHDQKVRAKP